MHQNWRKNGAPNITQHELTATKRRKMDGLRKSYSSAKTFWSDDPYIARNHHFRWWCKTSPAPGSQTSLLAFLIKATDVLGHALAYTFETRIIRREIAMTCMRYWSALFSSIWSLLANSDHLMSNMAGITKRNSTKQTGLLEQKENTYTSSRWFEAKTSLEGQWVLKKSGKDKRRHRRATSRDIRHW